MQHSYSISNHIFEVPLPFFSLSLLKHRSGHWGTGRLNYYPNVTQQVVHRGTIDLIRDWWHLMTKKLFFFDKKCKFGLTNILLICVNFKKSKTKLDFFLTNETSLSKNLKKNHFGSTWTEIFCFSQKTEKYYSQRSTLDSHSSVSSLNSARSLIYISKLHWEKSK